MRRIRHSSMSIPIIAIGILSLFAGCTSKQISTSVAGQAFEPGQPKVAEVPPPPPAAPEPPPPPPAAPEPPPPPPAAPEPPPPPPVAQEVPPPPPPAAPEPPPPPPPAEEIRVAEEPVPPAPEPPPPPPAAPEPPPPPPAAPEPPPPPPVAQEVPPPPPPAAPEPPPPPAVAQEVPPPPPPAAIEQPVAAAPAPAVELVDAYFDFDRFVLRPDARTALESNGRVLKSDLKDTRILIEGHCDEVGTAAYNLVLGEKRAQAAKRYLEDLGVPASRMQTTSYGKERPVCTEHSPDCWQKNRRVHFAIK